MITSRTITSALNNSFDCDFGHINTRRNDFPAIKKSVAVGSIHEFMFSIPTLDVKTRKQYGQKRYSHTGIFSNEYKFYNNYKRTKVQVNMTDLRNDPNLAGISSTHRQNSTQNNHKIFFNNLNSPTKNENGYKKNLVKKNLVNSTKKVNYKTKATINIFGTSLTEASCSTRNTSAKKTFYNNDEYRKFFNKNYHN